MPAYNTFTITDTLTTRFVSRLRRARSERHPKHDHTPSGDPFDSFTWPRENTLLALGETIAATQCLALVVRPIPEKMRHAEVSGLTTVIGQTAHVFYDEDLSPLNREQAILHEYAHILHGDVRADNGAHMRSMFEDPIEKRAETTGMRLLAVLHRKQLAEERIAASEVLDFFSGTAAPWGRA